MPNELKRNEKHLRESEEKYKLILDNANDLITIINENLEHEYINEKAYFELLGYTKENIIGKTPLTPLHPDDVKLALKTLRDGFMYGEGRNEMRIRHKDGNYIWFEHKGKTFVDIDGKKKAIIISRDITERKIAEQKLKESEAKYREMIENIEDGYFEVDLKGKYTYVNDYICRYMGISKEQILGKSYSHFLDKDTIKDVFKIFNKVYINNLPKGTFESQVRRSDGQIRTFEGSFYLRYDSRGQKVGFYGFTRDITERKITENAKREEYRKLEELSEIKSESLMRASHELKTPLSSVYAAAQMLLKNFKEQLGDDILSFIEIIYRGSQKLRQLIENMLDASKLESKELKLNLNDENLIEIINNCINDLKLWADKRNVTIKANLTKEFILKVDRIRIEQVIINLLSNAIKYTPPKGEIIINLNEKEKYIEISITDNGIGLTKKDKVQLFQKFGKIKRFPNQLDIEYEGTGLGLYISKEIVELHNGKIIVKSQGRNKGSTFIIRLPK